MRLARLGILFTVMIVAALIQPIAGVAAQAQSPEAKQTKAVVRDAAAKERLLGTHLLSLHWISWDYVGKAVVTEAKGVLK